MDKTKNSVFKLSDTWEDQRRSIYIVMYFCAIIHQVIPGVHQVAMETALTVSEEMSKLAIQVIRNLTFLKQDPLYLIKKGED